VQQQVALLLEEPLILPVVALAELLAVQGLEEEQSSD
jgi:hypothetical protein